MAIDPRPPSWSKGLATTSLAIERTAAGIERTLRSALRTALALISFGFTIYLLFTKEALGSLLPPNPDARLFAAGLISLGLILLGLTLRTSARSYRDLAARVQRLQALGLTVETAGPPGNLVFRGVVMLVVGAGLLAVTLFRLLR